MKQTAVEWLQQALNDKILDYEQIFQAIALFEQAKEMEKEHIVNAYTSNSMIRTNSKAEKYYNETFKTNEK